jgi:hypothetical protein
LLFVPAFTIASCSSAVTVTPLTVVAAANWAAVIGVGVAVPVGDGVGVGAAGAGVTMVTLPAPGEATPSAPLQPDRAVATVESRSKRARLVVAM